MLHLDLKPQQKLVKHLTRDGFKVLRNIGQDAKPETGEFLPNSHDCVNFQNITHLPLGRNNLALTKRRQFFLTLQLG
ncbi:hypothetical protein QUB80_24405 [Chlorogloeopsis sp. ULAP01]|uniref:hypothetical protein n=1 Tax=Chlorogloeopsis sp. ULAP01 TaxID=3056483 RepID=UPI0025AAC3D7|nr:hypothetical protein [Chlorogloeopsis sp. ULAP01]MDM9383831.1 hypothetical protein [Chlorogloeopsis sp. ULAP01]